MESKIQEILFEYFYDKHHFLICPNTYVLGHESDLITVTKTGFLHEIEIKASRSDFLHEIRGNSRIKKRKHMAMSKVNPKNINTHLPNYFWFAFSGKIYKKKEIPNYAGILRIKNNEVKIIKKAQRLHGNKLSEKKRDYLGRGLTVRYWKERIGN